ncbi:MAG TPA: TonB family protein [Blastocatellia bacterium]|nr:TonB family protein [Blastocatellia bacterium]
MKLVFLTIVFLSTYVGVAQTDKQSNTPVQILYGTRTADQRRQGPVISGVLNSKVRNELSPVYPQKAKEQKIQGRVEIQLLVNEDGEVIFANPLSGPEELWAESVKTAVSARFKPLILAGKPAKITGRIILDFKDGEAVVPKRDRV